MLSLLAAVVFSYQADVRTFELDPAAVVPLDARWVSVPAGFESAEVVLSSFDVACVRRGAAACVLVVFGASGGATVRIEQGDELLVLSCSGGIRSGVVRRGQGLLAVGRGWAFVSVMGPRGRCFWGILCGAGGAYAH